MTLRATPASPHAYVLGEGPVWDPIRERLLWVDIARGTVHTGRVTTATGQVTPVGWRAFDTTVGAVAVAADGQLVVAERSVLTRVDPDGRRHEIARVLPDDRRGRLNDGAVDPAGRFLIGSMALDGRRGRAVLARLDEGGCVRLDTDLTLSNGLAWSPAGDLLYSIDSVPGVVWVRDYDAPSGRCGPRRELFRVTDGLPDGMCADADGNLWIAVWGRGRVECRAPDGRPLTHVEVAAPHVTSVTFAGPGLDVLVITTATDELSAEELAAHPDSGRLFTARVGARGLPPVYWTPPCGP